MEDEGLGGVRAHLFPPEGEVSPEPEPAAVADEAGEGAARVAPLPVGGPGQAHGRAVEDPARAVGQAEDDLPPSADLLLEADVEDEV